MTTTTEEHEPEARSKDAIDAWHEAVAVAREERRQRGERRQSRRWTRRLPAGRPARQRDKSGRGEDDCQNPGHARRSPRWG